MIRNIRNTVAIAIAVLYSSASMAGNSTVAGTQVSDYDWSQGTCSTQQTQQNSKATVPEPATIAAVGVLLAAFVRRRQRSNF